MGSIPQKGKRVLVEGLRELTLYLQVEKEALLKKVERVEFRR